MINIETVTLESKHQCHQTGLVEYVLLPPYLSPEYVYRLSYGKVVTKVISEEDIILLGDIDVK